MSGAEDRAAAEQAKLTEAMTIRPSGERSGVTIPELYEAVRGKLGTAELARLRGLPDDATIRMPSEFSARPHTRYATTPEELRDLIRQAAASIPDLDPAAFEDDIAHETEHAAAAATLGCTSRLAFTVAPLTGDVWYSVASHVYISRKPLSKLAMATITAAPAQLSDGDLADLRRMGYRDAEDVAARVRVAGHRLPMPASAELEAEAG